MDKLAGVLHPLDYPARLGLDLVAPAGMWAIGERRSFDIAGPQSTVRLGSMTLLKTEKRGEHTAAVFEQELSAQGDRLLTEMWVDVKRGILLFLRTTTMSTAHDLRAGGGSKIVETSEFDESRSR